jgi:hypothetical protein
MVLFAPIGTIVKTVAGESAGLRLSVDVPGYALGKTVRYVLPVGPMPPRFRATAVAPAGAPVRATETCSPVPSGRPPDLVRESKTLLGVDNGR